MGCKFIFCHGYSKNLNNGQTLAGFVDNYDLIYKILQKNNGNQRKHAHRGAPAAPVFSLLKTRDQGPSAPGPGPLGYRGGAHVDGGRRAGGQTRRNLKT